MGALSSAPAPSASVSPPAPTEPPSFPLPPVPPGIDADKLAFLWPICPAAYRIDQLGPGQPPRTGVGCRVHPPFDVPSRFPDGTFPQHTDEPISFCELVDVRPGSYRRAGAKEALLTFEQCKYNDSDVWDAAFPGSAVLVEEIRGRWKSVAYAPDVNLGFCEPIRWTDGHESLVCWSGFAAPPMAAMWYLFVLDFTRPEPHSGTFMRIFYNMFSCGWAGTGPSTEAFVTLDNFKRSFRDLNRDGVKDVVLELDRSYAPPSPQFDARVASRCSADPNTTAKDVMPRPRRHRLEFVSDDTRFVPTPATKRLLDQWDAETPDQGVREAAPPDLH